MYLLTHAPILKQLVQTLSDVNSGVAFRKLGDMKDSHPPFKVRCHPVSGQAKEADVCVIRGPYVAGEGDPFSRTEVSLNGVLHVGIEVGDASVCEPLSSRYLKARLKALDEPPEALPLHQAEGFHVSCHHFS